MVKRFIDEMFRISVQKRRRRDGNEEKNNKESEVAIKLKEENAALNDKVLRISAEMQNMRRRYEDEISNIYKYEG